MKIYYEKSLKDFEFWSEAEEKVKYLTEKELDFVEKRLEHLHPNGIEASDLNDFFWFEDDLIAIWLDYDSFEEIMERGEEI